jgi:hypothetical protein
MTTEELTIKLDGRTYIGYYSVEAGLITVSYGGIRETSQVGGSGSNPEDLARNLLRELVMKRHGFG